MCAILLHTLNPWFGNLPCYCKWLTFGPYSHDSCLLIPPSTPSLLNPQALGGGTLFLSHLFPHAGSPPWEIFPHSHPYTFHSHVPLKGMSLPLNPRLPDYRIPTVRVQSMPVAQQLCSPHPQTTSFALGPRNLGLCFPSSYRPTVNPPGKPVASYRSDQSPTTSHIPRGLPGPRSLIGSSLVPFSQYPYSSLFPVGKPTCEATSSSVVDPPYTTSLSTVPPDS